MSPTVFREGPFRAYFFSREESRMHVHVQSAQGEAKFWIEPEIELAANFGLPEHEIVKILNLIRRRKMKSEKPGTDTLEVEVSNVSRHGFWVFLEDRELFVSFQEFPWFEQAAISKILHVERPGQDHLYWPELDIDLSVESIEHPDRFPLISKSRA